MKKILIPVLSMTFIGSLFVTTHSYAETNIQPTMNANENNTAMNVLNSKTVVMKQVSVNTNLNLRSQPTTNSSIIGKLKNGTVVQVLSETNGWSHVTVNGQQGYVNTSYLKPHSTITPPPSGQEKDMIVSVKTSLNVRSNSSTSASVIGKLKNGNVVKVSSESNGWSTIAFNGTTGYVSSQYLKASTGTTPPPVTPEVTGKKKVSVNTSLNMRSQPSTNASVVSKLSNGTIVDVYSTSNGWSHVKANGKTGYVSSQYLVDVNSGGGSTENPSMDALITSAKSHLGKPYVFGANGPNSFDCSGYIYYVFKNNGYNISRMSVAGYWPMATKVSNPQPGDLIFFQNTYKPGPSHMGILVGNGKFIHASSSKGVVISDVNSSYYREHFLGYGKFSK